MMTEYEAKNIRQAIRLLQQIVDEPIALKAFRAAFPPKCPVEQFVRKHVTLSPQESVSCAELLGHYNQLVAAGQLGAVPETIFRRRLPVIIKELFVITKSHSVVRDGRQARGFKGIGLVNLPNAAPAGNTPA